MVIEAQQKQDIVIEMVDPRALHPHFYNATIYGDNELTDDLEQKIAVSKWIKPLVITQDNKIISGHRRNKTAIKLGWSLVPVERRVFASEIEEIEALLLENVSREKTVVQKLNEAEAWEHIETERAKGIQASQGMQGKEHGKEGGRGNKKAKPLVEPVPQGVLDGDNERAKNDKKSRAPATRDKVAAQVGLGSGKNYENAKRANNAAKQLEQKGKVEEAQVLREVLNKPGNIKAAAQVASLPEEKQVAVLGAIATGKAKDIKEAKAVVRQEEQAEQAKSISLPDTMRILHADFREAGFQFSDSSVDMIFTDPPYHDEHLSLWNDLGAFAARVLKPGGILLSYSGQLFLPQVLSSLEEHLDYCWLIGIAHSKGHIQIWKHALWNDWKPIVMFSKGKPVEHDWFMDLYRGDKGDKEAHEWSQGEGEAAYFIEKLTRPGQLVVDPMCGSGTILHAAHKLKRRTCGMEVDQARYNVALGNMKDLQEVQA